MQASGLQQRVRVLDPDGRPGFYRQRYGTDTGIADGRIIAGSDVRVRFDSGKAGYVPSSRIRVLEDDPGPKPPTAPVQGLQASDRVSTLTDAYEAAQRYLMAGKKGIRIAQLLGADGMDQGWYVSHTGDRSAA